MSIEPAATTHRVWPTASPIPLLPPVAEPARKTPYRFAWFSYGLIILLVFIYLVENSARVDPAAPGGLSTLSLISMGGLGRWLVVGRNEAWRLVTYGFLHATPVHLISNCVALWIIGPPLERTIGRRWTAAIFILGVLVGGVTSLVWVADFRVSVGASGGIVALFAAAIPAAVSRLEGRARVFLLLRGVICLLLTFVPVPTSAATPVAIDTAAHVGGGLAGALVAFFVVFGTAGEPPRGGRIALGFDLFFMAAVVLAQLPLSREYFATRAVTQTVATTSGAPVGEPLVPKPRLAPPAIPAPAAPPAAPPVPQTADGQGGLPPPAPLQIASPSEAVDLPLSQIQNATIVRTSAGLWAAMTHYYYLKPDCTPDGSPVLFRIVHPPQHGRLLAHNEPVLAHFPPGPFGACDGRAVPGETLGYVAFSGYVGPDYVEYLAVQPHRTIDVRVPIFIYDR